MEDIQGLLDIGAQSLSHKQEALKVHALSQGASSTSEQGISM